MNIFRLAGDLSHVLAIIILLLRIWKTKSCAGISGRSQILFALTYTTRYLDLFSNFISIYNSVMKIFFIGASYATLYLMYVKFKATYDRNHDTFQIEFLVTPVVILALFVNHDCNPLEILWTFSIYLESVAILPQLFLVYKTGEVEITSHYLFCLVSYKALYIFNWVYRYYSEGFYDLIASIAGVVQTVLYCGFFYLYITKELKKIESLPVSKEMVVKIDSLISQAANKLYQPWMHCDFLKPFFLNLKKEDCAVMDKCYSFQDKSDSSGGHKTACNIVSITVDGEETHPLKIESRREVIHDDDRDTIADMKLSP